MNAARTEGYCWTCRKYKPLGLAHLCTGCLDAWYEAKAARVRPDREHAEITLDLCSGEGGGARGLAQAGHYVVGVDINPRCRDGYLRSGAHEFIAADAMDVLRDPGFLARFTFISAHPPCQAYSRMSHCRPGVAARYPALIGLMQPLLDATGLPFTIENVEGARPHLRKPVTYCMWMFGREAYRHRLIEAGGGLKLIPRKAPAVNGTRVNRACGWPHPVATARAGHWEPGKFVSVAGHERKEPVRRVMEIDWMSGREAVKEAIPPYLGFEEAVQLADWRDREMRPAASRC